MKWFVESSLNLVGYESYSILEIDEEDPEVAEDIAWELAYDNAESYFSVIDENDSDEYEANGEEYNRTFIFDSDVYCNIEIYNPEKHDGYLT